MGPTNIPSLSPSFPTKNSSVINITSQAPSSVPTNRDAFIIMNTSMAPTNAPLILQDTVSHDENKWTMVTIMCLVSGGCCCMVVIITCKLFWNQEIEQDKKWEEWDKRRREREQYKHVAQDSSQISTELKPMQQTSENNIHIAGHSISMSDNINTVDVPSGNQFN